MKIEKFKKFFASKAAKSAVLVVAVLLIGLAVYLNYRWFYDPLGSLGYGENNMENGYTDSETTGADTSAGTKAKNFKDKGSINSAGLPSAGDNQVDAKTLTTQLKDAASYASSLFSNFGETFMGTLENVRDDLFAVDYIFSTFTHDTFDNEGYYSNLSEENQGKVKPSNINTYYTADIKKAWTGSDEIKTLTLHPRTSTTNWAYGGEIEYILYGNNTDKANKKTAYTNIFMLRYALDLVPVFQV